MNVNGTNQNFNGTIAAPFGPTLTIGVLNVFTASPTANQLAEVSWSICLKIPAPLNSIVPLAFSVSPPGPGGGSLAFYQNALAGVSQGPLIVAGGVSGVLLSAVGKQAFAYASLAGKAVLAPGATFEIPYLFDNYSGAAGDTMTIAYNGEYDVTYISG